MEGCPVVVPILVGFVNPPVAPPGFAPTKPPLETPVGRNPFKVRKMDDSPFKTKKKNSSSYQTFYMKYNNQYKIDNSKF